MKRLEFNRGLKLIADRYECILSRSPYISEQDVYSDGTHLTVESGVKRLVRAYKITTNKLLGLTDPYTTSEYNFHNSGNIKSQQQNDMNNNSHRYVRYQSYRKPTFHNNYRTHDVNIESDRNYPFQRQSHLYNNPMNKDHTSTYVNKNPTFYHESRTPHRNDSQLNSPTPPMFTGGDSNFIDYNHGYKINEDSNEKLKWHLAYCLRELSCQ